jgi:hypothetical protein
MNMKNHFSPAAAKNFARLIIVGAFIFCAAPVVFADDATNPAASAVKHGLNFQFKVGPEKSDDTNYYGLPKEAFDRLTPEQIVELAKSNEPPAALIAIVPVAMFAMIIGCVWLGVSQRSKRAALLHETLRLMIEKGQPIPPELLQSPDGLRRPRNDLRNGLVLIGLGLAVGISLFSQNDADWPMAFIPLLIGAAFLVARKLEQNQNGQPK